MIQLKNLIKIQKINYIFSQKMKMKLIKFMMKLNLLEKYIKKKKKRVIFLLQKVKKKLMIYKK